MAGSDCGYGTWVGQAAVDPDVVWAKMAAMAEGARIATREFWKQAIVGHRASDDDLAYATSLLLKHDTIADTLARARHYGQRAVDAIGGFRSSQAKASWAGVASSCRAMSFNPLCAASRPCSMGE